MLQPTRIIVHHSKTIDSGTVSWAAIRKFHVEQLGWLDTGYHAGVELVNGTYECFYGRPVTMRGAHAAGANANSLGFCFVGDYDAASPEPAMLAAAARRVLAPWCAVYGIQTSAILPHSMFALKTCPGSMFVMDELRSMVQAALAGQNGGTL